MSEVTMRLKGKVSVITGGGQGIGYATCLRFAKEGSFVAIADINAKKGKKSCEAVKRKGGKAIFIETDVTKPDEVRRMIDKTLQAFGRISILVNNAGTRPITPFTEITDKEWDSIIRLNLTSVFLCSRAAVPYLAKDRGKIINISSISGLLGSANRATYCASKAGVINLTRTMAVELSVKKINVNAIAPGIISTPLTAHYTSTKDRDSIAMKKLISAVPLGRWGKPEEIAAAAVFLASDDAKYITGIILPVDGGWTACL